MAEHSPLSIFFHNFYAKNLDWIDKFQSTIPAPFNLFYNYVPDSYHHIKEDSKHNLIVKPREGVNIITRTTPNVGKDIGGKLVLLDAYLQLPYKSETLLFLHDKQSRYHEQSESWRDMLLKIGQKEFLYKALRVFRTNSKVGIVCDKNSLRNERDNDQQSRYYIDSPEISKLRDQYNIHNTDLRFSAGTMFYVRASIFEEFFQTWAPLEIRKTLEHGNVTDHYNFSVTHAWERLLNWLVLSKGFTIEGI